MNSPMNTTHPSASPVAPESQAVPLPRSDTPSQGLRVSVGGVHHSLPLPHYPLSREEAVHTIGG